VSALDMAQVPKRIRISIGRLVATKDGKNKRPQSVGHFQLTRPGPEGQREYVLDMQAHEELNRHLGLKMIDGKPSKVTRLPFMLPTAQWRMVWQVSRGVFRGAGPECLRTDYQIGQGIGEARLYHWTEGTAPRCTGIDMIACDPSECKRAQASASKPAECKIHGTLLGMWLWYLNAGQGEWGYFTTTSPNSVRQIATTLAFAQERLGGYLAGIPLYLDVGAEKKGMWKPHLVSVVTGNDVEVREAIGQAAEQRAMIAQAMRPLPALDDPWQTEERLALLPEFGVAHEEAEDELLVLARQAQWSAAHLGLQVEARGREEVLAELRGMARGSVARLVPEDPEAEVRTHAAKADQQDMEEGVLIDG